MYFEIKLVKSVVKITCQNLNNTKNTNFQTYKVFNLMLVNKVDSIYK